MAHVLNVPATRRPPLVGLGGRILAEAQTVLALLTARVREWRRRARGRSELRTLSDRSLRDFRCTRCDAQREARKFFWQE